MVKINALTTILLTIAVFEALILTHELGHYITARIFDVHILEFSVGMGPRIISRKSKKTGIIYSLRLLPIGGFVQMVGENGEDTLNESELRRYGEGSEAANAPERALPPDDPRALSKKPVWQRMIIIAAGGVTNILIGIILTFAMVMNMPALGGTVVAEFSEGATSCAENKLRKDDIILKVNNTRVSTHMMLAYSVMYYGDKPVDLTVIRGAELHFNEEGEYISYSGGEKIVIEDVEFPRSSAEEVGAVFGDMDFSIYRTEKNLSSTLHQSSEYCRMMVKTVWDGLYDLIRGRYGIEAVSGPVGVSSEIGTAARQGSTSFLYIIILLSVNLGIVNLLPIPALDGGHLVFLIIELIRGKPVDPEIRGRINGVALIILFGFAIFIMFKDIVGLFR